MMANLPNDLQVFFQEALLNIYQTRNNQFGFTYYRNRGFWEVYNEKPIYPSLDAALCGAKLYCLMSSVAFDTEEIRFTIDFSNDVILAKSPPAKRWLGKTEGYTMRELYTNESDRADIHRKLESADSLTTNVCLQNLDGKRIEGLLEVELIKLGQATITLETLKPHKDAP